MILLRIGIIAEPESPNRSREMGICLEQTCAGYQKTSRLDSLLTYLEQRKKQTHKSNYTLRMPQALSYLSKQLTKINT